MACLSFHLAVVLEKAHVVDGRLDAQHAREFVIHLDASGAHGVLDAAPLDARGQPRADFLGPLRCDLLAQEPCNALSLGGEHRLARDRVVQWYQDVLAAKHQVGGVFGLAQAPVVGLPEYVEHRTQPLGVAVQSAVQRLGVEPVGQCLRPLEVGHTQEGVVLLDEVDAFARHRPCQRTVAVAVELQAEGCPGRHAQITQAKLFRR